MGMRGVTRVALGAMGAALEVVEKEEMEVVGRGAEMGAAMGAMGAAEGIMGVEVPWTVGGRAETGAPGNARGPEGSTGAARTGSTTVVVCSKKVVVVTGAMGATGSSTDARGSTGNEDAWRGMGAVCSG
jgi:hypothetical protein